MHAISSSLYCNKVLDIDNNVSTSSSPRKPGQFNLQQLINNLPARKIAIYAGPKDMRNLDSWRDVGRVQEQIVRRPIPHLPQIRRRRKSPEGVALTGTAFTELCESLIKTRRGFVLRF
jgi:hypothetical protein